MRRIAFCLYALVLALPLVGCKKEETPAPKTDTPAANETPPPARPKKRSNFHAAPLPAGRGARSD